MNTSCASAISPLFKLFSASLLLLLVVVLGPNSALADDSTLVLEQEVSANEMAVASLIGPQVGVHGPPTALKFQVQFWREIADSWAFHSAVAVTASGETTMSADDSRSADATYSSTAGAEFFAGVRRPFDLGWGIATHARGGLAVDVTGGEELIGYMIGPSAAAGLTYPLSDGLELIGEAELGLGFGQYKASGPLMAATLDLLIGAQVRF